jgi:predicted nucleotidyltransferase
MNPGMLAPKEAKELVKKIKGVKTRLTFPFPLGELRHSAIKVLKEEKKPSLELINKLRSSQDMIEQRVGEYLLSKIGEGGDKHVLEVLKKLEEKNVRPVREAIKKARSKHQDLEKILKTLSEHDDLWVREVIAKNANQLGKYGPLILEKLASDEQLGVKEAVLKSAWKMGESGLPILKKFVNDKNRFVSTMAKDAVSVFAGYSELFWNQKPLFATPYTKELVKKVSKLNEVSKQLKEEFGNAFVGISVLGSTSRGDMGPKEDLDYTMIAENEKVLKRFNELAGDELLLDKEGYVKPGNIESLSPDGVSMLFSGIFFGDNKRLSKLQSKAVEKMDDSQWDQARKRMLSRTTDISKGVEKGGVLEHATSLLRVPRTREETLKVLKRRMKE